MSSDTPILQTRALSIGYAEGSRPKSILDNLDLQIAAGEFICLLGPNGTGKSTLIRTLSGLQAALSGDLQIKGNALDSLTPRERARQISVVLTDGMPTCMMDARMLVSLGRHPYSGWLGKLSTKDTAAIDTALESVGASELAERQVAELSDGERQKIAIARALAQEAELMFLDEPTAFLDLPRRVELMARLRQLARNKLMGLLLSTHDLDLALRYADRVWIIEGNRLIQGYPEALALDGELAQVFIGENLHWDVERGVFELDRGSCVKVHLKGSGANLFWTQRCLERLGYGITECIESSAFRIDVLKASWSLETNDTEVSFDTISELIHYLESQHQR